MARPIDTLIEPEPSVASFKGWQGIITYLSNWWYGVPGMEEEGLTPPTKQVLAHAISIAKSLEKQPIEPPSRVVPNGEGGIIFEHYGYSGNDRIYETIEIFDNLNVELSYYKNSRLISKKPIIGSSISSQI